jgi:chromosome segregation ATPase
MPRPQKYTDSEIMAAAQALIVEGGEINPMRVRMRLGGGNVSRIKAVVAKMPPQEPLSASPSGLPQTLVRELQQMSSEASQQFLSVVARYWTSTLAESGPAREENAALRRQIDGLEREALASSERLAQAERQRDEMDRAVKQLGKERDELAQNFGGLQSALRNAESDFRAAQRMIDTFERNRREDRDEIRDLQKRIEDLVGEIALLRVKASGQQQKVRSRSAGTSKSRVGRAT